MKDEFNPFSMTGAVPAKKVDEDECLLPIPGEPYKAFGRASVKPVYTLHCILGREGYRSFQYVHLDGDSRFGVGKDGHVIQVRFCGSEAWQVTIRGRNLKRAYVLLHQHRLPWVMVAERDFSSDGDEIVTAIEIEEIQDQE